MMDMNTKQRYRRCSSIFEETSSVSTLSKENSNNTSTTATIQMAKDLTNFTQEEIEESMACLKEKLDLLKTMVESSGGQILQSKKTPTFIDEHVLSAIFAVALAAILGITVYAFQGLYVAVTKKWSS